MGIGNAALSPLRLPLPPPLSRSPLRLGSGRPRSHSARGQPPLSRPPPSPSPAAAAAAGARSLPPSLPASRVRRTLGSARSGARRRHRLREARPRPSSRGAAARWSPTPSVRRRRPRRPGLTAQPAASAGRSWVLAPSRVGEELSQTQSAPGLLGRNCRCHSAFTDGQDTSGGIKEALPCPFQEFTFKEHSLGARRINIARRKASGKSPFSPFTDLLVLMYVWQVLRR